MVVNGATVVENCNEFSAASIESGVQERLCSVSIGLNSPAGVFHESIRNGQTVQPAPNGEWQVTLPVLAKTIVAFGEDLAGNIEQTRHERQVER
jgi:hypothetical protein